MDVAYFFKSTSKGPCRSSQTNGVNIAISNAFLVGQGLMSLTDWWINIHYEHKVNRTVRSRMQGGWRLGTSGYPIIFLSYSTSAGSLNIETIVHASSKPLT